MNDNNRIALLMHILKEKIEIVMNAKKIKVLEVIKEEYEWENTMVE